MFLPVNWATRLAARLVPIGLSWRNCPGRPAPVLLAQICAEICDLLRECAPGRLEAGSISAACDRRIEKLENPTQPTP